MTIKEEKFIKKFIDILLEFDVARDIYKESEIDRLDEEIYMLLKDNTETIRKCLKESIENQRRMEKWVKFLGGSGIGQLEELTKK